jgi:hypothetical protein
MHFHGVRHCIATLACLSRTQHNYADLATGSGWQVRKKKNAQQLHYRRFETVLEGQQASWRSKRPRISRLKLQSNPFYHTLLAAGLLPGQPKNLSVLRHSRTLRPPAAATYKTNQDNSLLLPLLAGACYHCCGSTNRRCLQGACGGLCPMLSSAFGCCVAIQETGAAR